MHPEITSYLETATGIFQKIASENPQMDAAGEAIARSIAEGKLIHVIGTGGHSNMAAEEVLWRAGGLAPVNAILDAGTNLVHGAKRSNIIERAPGYAARVFDSYRLGRTPGEIIIIANGYGINTMTIDAVLEAKKRGMVTIGVTSTGFADRVPRDHPARHASGLNLYQEADYFINTFMPYGDAAVSFEGMDQKAGPTSTLCNVFAMNLLMLTAIRKLREMGIEPPLWMSANLPGGDEKNRALEDKYLPLVRHL
ncbi:MAG TPA: sugar isomerase domain-containing protein [Candidatus Limnocylindria bacterium]|nr:sugar isomerase domain-containing protein [Candidatus Limnocylindria bacterium]